MSRLINKTRVKRHVLIVANENAPCALPEQVTDSNGREWDYSRCFKVQKRRYTQVSEKFMEELEAEFRVILNKKLSDLPKTGKTIK